MYLARFSAIVSIAAGLVSPVLSSPTPIDTSVAAGAGGLSKDAYQVNEYVNSTTSTYEHHLPATSALAAVAASTTSSTTYSTSGAMKDVATMGPWSIVLISGGVFITILY